jgi:hypothetical protein
MCKTTNVTSVQHAEKGPRQTAVSRAARSFLIGGTVVLVAYMAEGRPAPSTGHGTGTGPVWSTTTNNVDRSLLTLP